MQPWYIATERFGSSHEGWKRYVDWSGLNHLDEIVSLDGMLCPPILTEIKADYWDHIVNEDFLLGYFVDLDFMLGELKGRASLAELNVLCVYRNPPSEPASPAGEVQWQPLGYDLIDVQSAVSALTNCGGFPLAFDNHELSRQGLIPSHERALAVQDRLKMAYPEERHAQCDVWALFRANEM